MAISFETEDACTVFLPETATMLLDPQKAREALERDRAYSRSHLYPLFDATARFACSLLMAPQGCNEFYLPRGPWIISIGDDFHFAWGPKAFPQASLDAAIRAADHAVLITSGPDPYPYRVAATVAVRDRKNALLIETRPNQKDHWKRRIEHIRDADEFATDLPITYCLPFPETKGAA
ncbi:hypothetical protein [Bradyrhizobium australafricanum]|uniref:hypothetical protein n=1 Tax=Bradyrhizobium australafricanum TaxID=2821406 RepID=UPI001CE37CF6|nr:hypothetical protein [Bradyrhizobium australafricanum]MCA6102779.1 hypothetical protein [Bradyrhizobium australafricanum]